MGKRGRLVCLAAFSLLLLSMFSAGAYAADYVARVQLSLEKSFYGPGEEVHLTGSVSLSNLSANDTSFVAVSGASVNFSISNSSTNGSALQSNHTLNTSSEGSFKSRSDLVPSGISVSASAGDGYYNVSTSYRDPNNVEWKTGGVIRVFTSSIDHVSVSPAEARYYLGETAIVTLKALREVGDKKVALANITINGSMRYTNRTTISTFFCTTANDGLCAVSVAVPSTVGTYLLEANNFLSISYFTVVPFEAFVYVKDSTGESFKEILKANEQASVEVNVKSNGSNPTGGFVFNGTITDSGNNVVANITSTTLNSNNSYTNRFSFTITNAFVNGIYYASITVYKTGTSSRVSTSTSFQVRSWSLAVNKGSRNSGFEYEYTTFPEKNVSFEIFPKEYENGTVITGLNSTRFNITLASKTGAVLAVGNATYNASCSSSGCYEFTVAAPSARGRYLLSVSLNHSSETQTAHRLMSVTTTSLSATPSNAEGQLKELFGTSEAVYISLSAKNLTSSVNITDVLLESVIYQNGTKFNFTEVAQWGNVSSNNSALEWAWNGSSQMLKLDAPKTGGNYLVNVFVNNRLAAASATFSVNPYAVCGAAKSTVGSVDSSSSFYVWQYKTTDTVYLELKVTQAQNGVGKATASNSTSGSSFNSAYYGMGRACSVDTTKTQAITNATIVVEEVVNLQTGTKATLNTSASACSADDNSGTYTCTVTPETKWDGGRYSVKLKITGADGETVDRAESVFEARAFYLWAYSNSWTNKPTSNITFNVQMYEAGTNWWSNAGGSTGGITGEVAIQKVEYNGKDGEWLWPPIDIGYNTTGLNASNISNGRGSFIVSTDRLPRKAWEPGYYVVTVKGTNTASGESDYGQAWLGIKQWETYATPVDTSGSSIQYKDSFGTKENVTLFVRITNAGDWSDSGNTNLAGGSSVSVGVKKLQYYKGGALTELNKSAYAFTYVNVTTSSPWYSSGNPGTHNKYFLNITPASGRWDGGYYNVILDVNSTETGYGWFNVISFGVDTQPTDSSGAYTYSTRGAGPRYFNVTTTKSKKTYYSYYKANDYINTTVKDMVLSVWREDTWQSEQLNYPEDLNVSPLWVNGSALVIVNKSGSWVGGYYWGEITVQDSENSTATGYLWFSVRSFRVDATVRNYTIDTDANVSVDLNTRQPDWGNNSVVSGNYTITGIYEDVWSGTGRSRTTYTNYKPNSTDTFNGTVILNVTPNSGSWGSGSYGGYHYLTAVVRDNSDSTTQTGWISFRAVPFSITVGNVGNQYSFSQSNNVTVAVSVNKSVDKSAAVANLTRAFEYTWPTQTEYGFAVGSCTSASNGTACQVNGTQNITLIAPSGGWPSGWHYIYLEFVAPAGGSKTQADGSAWFNAVQAYDGYFSNVDEGGLNYKYNFGLSENITIGIVVRNSNYAPQQVNITSVEMSEDGDSCWTESCKTYGNYSYNMLNGSGGNELKGNGTIRVLLNSSQWRRGQHSIRATVSGSAGTAVIKTGYIYVKDTAALNATIVSPTNGQVVNITSFMFNATTNKDARCSLTLVNYDQFSNWYCYSGNSGNASTGGCNSTRFNGSTAYYQSVNYPPWGPMNTGGRVHRYNFSTEGWTNQDYGIKIGCNDADWNWADATVSFTFNGSVAARPVNVNLTSPANTSMVNASTVTFRYNVSGPSSSSANCSVYVNVSNSWAANLSSVMANIANATNITAVNVAGFNNGTYVWNTYCFQTTNTSNSAWAPSNFTFTVATNSTAANSSNMSSYAVSVNLTAPVNNMLLGNPNVTFQYNVTGPANVEMSCGVYANVSNSWVLNSSMNSSLSGNSASANLTVNAFNNGTYVWNTYCYRIANSSQNAWAAGNLTFTVADNSTNSSSGSSSSGTNVSVNLSSPANNTGANASAIGFAYNVSAAGISSVNCTLWGNFSGLWAANFTNNSISPGSISAPVSATYLSLSTGEYLWNTKCSDATNSSSFAWAAYNWTFRRNSS